MTKENLTSLNVIIDRSGSMSGLRADTIGSFNSFLAEQKAFPGEALLTLCTFSDDYRLVHDFVKIASVPALDTTTYRTDGNTALLDAMGATIDEVGRKLAAMPEEERPSKVLFLIITDGQENHSRRYSAGKIKEMVEHQRSVYSWEFVFMGANIDSITTGTNLGISAQNTLNYAPTAAGTHRLYSTISSSTRAYRSSNSSIAPDFFNQSTVPQTATPATPATPSTPVTPATPTTGSSTTTK